VVLRGCKECRIRACRNLHLRAKLGSANRSGKLLWREGSHITHGRTDHVRGAQRWRRGESGAEFRDRLVGHHRKDQHEWCALPAIRATKMWSKISERCRKRCGTIFVMRSVEQQVTIVATAECIRNQFHATRPARGGETGAQLFVAYRGDASIAECVKCCGGNRGVRPLVSTKQANMHGTATVEFYLNAVASK